MDMSEVFTAQVRGLQGLYPQAHKSLCNWGHWSRDRSGIYPTLSPPGMWDQALVSKFGDFADEGEGDHHAPHTEQAKAERAEREPYDEKTANELDERLHHNFTWRVRKCLMVAYVTLEVPETDFPRLACCGYEDFLERMERVLGAL